MRKAVYLIGRMPKTSKSLQTSHQRLCNTFMLNWIPFFSRFAQNFIFTTPICWLTTEKCWYQNLKRFLSCYNFCLVTKEAIKYFFPWLLWSYLKIFKRILWSLLLWENSPLIISLGSIWPTCRTIVPQPHSEITLLLLLGAVVHVNYFF